MARVLVSAPLAGGAIAPLLAAHEVDIGEAPTGLPRDELLRRVADKEALVALLSNRIDDELLDRAPALRVVANHAVGVDNVDLEACKRRGVVVTNTPDVLSDATADFTFALLLAACRRLTEADRLARSGTWPGWSPTELCGVRVTGATLGIVGLGRIGQAVARRARGFGMRVVYAQRRRAAVEIERELSAEHRSLEALLAESDVVSLHCPLTPETHHLLDERRLAAMKPGAVLVNTARGGCVDARALARAVASGHLAGAGLDVFEAEPFIEPELVAEERIVLATHIASADLPTRERMGAICVEAVLAVLRGEEPRCRVA